MSNEKSHKIDAIKYFVPLPEGDYDFQEHLTDYLLTDILNANKQLEKYEARVKELEEKLKRKTQECEELLKENQQLRNSLSDSLIFKFTGQENETNRYRKALEEIEKQCKCYGRSKYTQEFDREYGGELDTNILDIIDNLKE